MSVSISKQGIVSASIISETPINPYDQNIYFEPDGSAWIRIVHHNNPASYIFSQSNSFSTGFYTDANRWFYVSICNKIKSGKYELMAKTKLTSSSSEIKYRWIQNVSPMNSVWADVSAANITRITTSGYTNSPYGGIYKRPDSAYTYICVNNGTEGNWFGAIGAWTNWNGGIPGWDASTAITTGYMDLYLRLNNLYDNNLSIGNSYIIANELIEI